MRSFRDELETPVVEKDILELEEKIHAYHGGSLDEDSFRSLRLARGVYGQRQAGVQMVRIKVPFGKISGEQLVRIANLSDEYSTGNLHLTTRQDVQLHYVSLDDTPELWAKLEEDNLTMREACGNTVRNITASHLAGVDPKEPFDVRPIADALFNYFLRNPICQEMGRKVKISFSSSEEDTALSFMHDVGFVPLIKEGVNGFKVLVAGGLGSQSRHADVYAEFAPFDEIIPITEAILRVFELHGERNRRMKARLKFLVKEIGFDTFKSLVEEQLQLLPKQSLELNDDYAIENSHKPYENNYSTKFPAEYDAWLKANVFKQKQDGLFIAGIKVKLGNIDSTQTRKLVELAHKLNTNEFTISIDQNLWLRHLSADKLEELYDGLRELNLADNGIQSILDVSACPGTDTCNLGIANSTGVAEELEKFIRGNYGDIDKIRTISIKISGCMNSCGQHMIAGIGFQGMSIKAPNGAVIPALQVLLGGGNTGNGTGVFADKVIKIPSKRVLQALELILNDFISNKELAFSKYYEEKGKMYFYELLKPLTDLDDLKSTDFIDWNQEDAYQKEVGVGECAGVMVDLVATLLYDSKEKLDRAQTSIISGRYKDAAYLIYQGIVGGAKARLLDINVTSPNHNAIIDAYQENFLDFKDSDFQSFKAFALYYQSSDIDKDQLINYLSKARQFVEDITIKRNKTN